MQRHFDSAKLKCSGPESDSCLTEPQITALRKIYAGPQLRPENTLSGLHAGRRTGAKRLGPVDYRTGPHAQFAICIWNALLQQYGF